MNQAASRSSAPCLRSFVKKHLSPAFPRSDSPVGSNRPQDFRASIRTGVLEEGARSRRAPARPSRPRSSISAPGASGSIDAHAGQFAGLLSLPGTSQRALLALHVQDVVHGQKIMRSWSVAESACARVRRAASAQAPGARPGTSNRSCAGGVFDQRGLRSRRRACREVHALPAIMPRIPRAAAISQPLGCAAGCGRVPRALESIISKAGSRARRPPESPATPNT
jgi:hypothetical protein